MINKMKNLFMIIKKYHNLNSVIIIIIFLI